MVSLATIRAPNATLSTKHPGLVAVFVGATSGIGLNSLKAFARYTQSPRIYFIGRSQSAGSRIAEECKALNPSGEYIFISADISLMRNVDEVVRDITAKEKYINVLFQSQGTLMNLGKNTDEGLHYMVAVTHYSKVRFTLGLLPLLRAESPSHLRTVVTSFAGGKEGKVFTHDIQGYNIPIRKARGHLSSIVTLSMEGLAKQAPEVSFIHAFPGHVKGNLIRGGEGLAIALAGIFFKATARFTTIVGEEECGDMHLFLATSERYPPAVGDEKVRIGEGGEVAVGTNGRVGSGVYSVNQDCESADIASTMRGLREEGADIAVWADVESHFKRIDGTK